MCAAALAVLLVAAMGAAGGAVCDPAVRTFDGSCNNLGDPTRGARGTPFPRGAEGVGYADGFSAPRVGPNERAVSNAMGAPDAANAGNSGGRTAWFAFEGQPFAHDIAATRMLAGHTEHLLILDPEDPLYARSAHSPPALVITHSHRLADEANVSQVPNDVSHYIDLSHIYGSNASVCDRLRTFEGGRLITSSYSVHEPALSNATIHLSEYLPNAARVGIDVDAEFSFIRAVAQVISGDFRVPENLVLVLKHLVWVLRHNYHADRYAALFPAWSDQQLMDKARAYTIAEYQHMIFDEYFPAIVGAFIYGHYAPYRGYDPDVVPGVSVLGSTSVMRFGHSLIVKDVRILDDDGELVGSLPHASMFDGLLDPLTANLVSGGPARLAQSLVALGADEMDEKFAPSMREIAAPFDIFAANLFRGRHHGLPGYDVVHRTFAPGGDDLYARAACAPTAPPSLDDDAVACFAYLTDDIGKAATLKELYSKISNVDPYVGLLIGKPFADSMLSLVHSTLVAETFDALRHGDRFWWENGAAGQLTNAEVAAVRDTRYADIMAGALGIPRQKLQNYVFFSPRAAANS